VSDDSDEDGGRHHPAGVGRGALDRGKEATVLGTVGRLRRLAAMVGGEYAREDGSAGRYFLLLSGNYRFLFRPLYKIFRCKTVKKLKSDCFTVKKIAKFPTPTNNSQKIAQVAALRLVILLQGVSVCLK
jgi:hypothetical protein